MKDILGRENRSLEDRTCPQCGSTFRPVRVSSRYCSRPCSWKNNGKTQQRKPEVWWKNAKGYIEGRIALPSGAVLHVKQHRFIMEGIIGRALLPTEDVHHRDGNKANNAVENLEIVDHGAHSNLTNKARTYRRGYKLNLTAEQRKARSLRAIAREFWKLGRSYKANEI